MGKVEIEAFFSDLAVNGIVSASTQNQAFSALLFLYEQVLDIRVFKNIKYIICQWGCLVIVIIVYHCHKNIKNNFKACN